MNLRVKDNPRGPRRPTPTFRCSIMSIFWVPAGESGCSLLTTKECMMNIRRNRAMRFLPVLASFGLVTILATPGMMSAQEFPRDELDRELDALATERAQALNQAYFDYEQELEEARQEAERLDQPSLFTERHEELRRDLETRILRIERRYERRRADILEEHTGRRYEGGEADERFGVRADEVEDRPEEPALYHDDEDLGVSTDDRARMAELNAELTEAWAEFHEAARELREKARRDEDWEGYEDAITRLEEQYQETIADIQRRQRILRFDIARERRADPPQ